MRIFITGATGFIGTELVEALLAKGHHVIALYRDQSRIRIRENKKLEWLKGELSDLDLLINNTRGVDVIFHLAAYAKVWAKDPELFRKVNVDGTRHVLEAARINQVNKVIITSTAGVIGPSMGSPVNEDTTRSIPFFSEYEKTKQEAEEVVKLYQDKGMSIILLLPTRLYGPGLLNESNSVTVLINRYINGNWHILPGNGSRTGNYVFISDVVTGHINAMNSTILSGRYLLGGEDQSYSDLFFSISRATGKKHWLMPVPAVLMIMVSYLIYGLARLTGRSPMITPGWARKYLHDWSVSSEKAKRDLGYSITPFKEGLAKTLVWIQSNKDV